MRLDGTLRVRCWGKRRGEKGRRLHNVELFTRLQYGRGSFNFIREFFFPQNQWLYDNCEADSGSLTFAKKALFFPIFT